MKKVTNKLGNQLLLILIIDFTIILIVLGILIPQLVTIKYESRVFENLHSKVNNIDKKVDTYSNISDYYIYVENDEIHYSRNCKDIGSDAKIKELISKLHNGHDKIRYEKKLFYYYVIRDKNKSKIIITDGTFIRKTEAVIIELTLSILLVAYFGIAVITIRWSRTIVKKIELLKEKVDNFSNENYDHSYKLKYDDELKSLEHAIEDMRLSIVKQEEMRNQLYQNISHDFKTPLTVIKSYIEAVNDEVEDKDKAFEVILEQSDKLENKVHSLLYLNKLDYLKDHELQVSENVNIEKIINSCVDVFKHHNDKIDVKISIDKNSKFRGTDDIWETVINNLLTNFYRYAEKEIKITVKNNKMIFYNDGPNIDEGLKDVIFIPFRKGIKGEFGLGLSIVQKSLTMIGYNINIENHKKRGVSFIIYKK